MSTETGVVAEGARLIRLWIRARSHVEHMRGALSNATIECGAAEKALANWLKPPDAKPFEKFSIWFGDSLFTVEVGGQKGGTPGDGPVELLPDRVTVRFQGEKFGELTQGP